MKRWFACKVLHEATVVAAVLAFAAAAHGDGFADLDAYSGSSKGPQKSTSRDVIQEAPEMRIEGTPVLPPKFFDHLGGLVERLLPHPDATDDSGSDWNLQLLHPALPKADLNDNPKTRAANPLGLGLKLKF